MCVHEIKHENYTVPLYTETVYIYPHLVNSSFSIAKLPQPALELLRVFYRSTEMKDNNRQIIHRKCSELNPLTRFSRTDGQNISMMMWGVFFLL